MWISVTGWIVEQDTDHNDALSIVSETCVNLETKEWSNRARDSDINEIRIDIWIRL